MARPLKPTFDQEEVKNFIRPMTGRVLRMVTQRGTSKIITSEAEHLLATLEAEPFILRLAHTSEPPSFSVKGDDPLISLKPDPTLQALGTVWKRLNAALHPRVQAVEEPVHGMTPRLMTFYQAFSPMMKNYSEQVVGGGVEIQMASPLVQDFWRLLTTGFDKFREEIDHPETKKEMKRLQSRINHNRQQQLKYVDSLLERYGTLLSLRLDLGYDVLSGYDVLKKVSYERAKNDFTTFMQERRHNPLWKNDLVGFIWKIEDGFERRFHYQLILIYKGEAIDSHLDDKAVLQDRWINEITSGDGACYQAWDDAQETPLGAEPEGLIDGKGSPHYIALTRFVDYLNKLDLMIRLNVPKGANVYGRGHAPRKVAD